jgi:cell division septum initiation protein DivIVA
VDVQKKLDDIVAAVEGARSMPMSASCVVNRADLLAMLEEVRAALPDALAQASAVLGDREQVVEEARREAERILASAHAERGSMISDTQVARESQDQADRIVAEARRDADEIRAEADDYVDSKLANFEVVLTKTLGAVDRGREKLLGRAPGMDDEADADVPERSTDPDVLRSQADEYVDTKLLSFEAVLGKTLEAVGRGRQKLLGRRPIDELGDYAALADGNEPHVGQTDADYVAALAGQLAQPAAPAGQSATAEQPRMPEQEPAAAQQPFYGDGYGYGGYSQEGYPAPAHQQQEAAQYPQGDVYAAQQGYGTDYQDPAAAYGWQQSGYGQDGAGYPAEPQQDPYAQVPQQQALPQAEAGYGGGSLDETSFFDTSLIDVQRLRELDGGR